MFFSMARCLLLNSPPSNDPKWDESAMTHLKNIIVDLLVTGLIIYTVVQDAAWGRVAIWIYTPLMLLLKIGALTVGKKLTGQVKSSDTPALWLHGLYGVNVAALLWGQWWIMAALWMGVWGLSAVYDWRQRERAAVARS